VSVLRIAALVAASALMTAWFVTLGVRATVGAPDAMPQVFIGTEPAPPRALGPLVIPRRDPFAADALATPAPAAPAVAGAAVAPGGTGAPLAATNVPDVAALGGTAASVGIVATIVGDGDAYALIEEGGSVRVARRGDALGGSTIVAISDRTVVLASGARIALDAQRAASAVAPAPTAAALATGSPAPGEPAASRAAGDPPAARAPEHDASAHGPPHSVTASPTGISSFGHTVLINPNGTPVLSPAPPAPVSGTLFPTVFASPTVVPSGASITPPGGPR
jgi:hypothetical protein